MLFANLLTIYYTAGLSIDSVNGSNTSAYVGSFMNDYETLTHKDLDVPNSYHATGKASAILANRLSWFYNLKGPSVAVNTACSGSLVALHLACESLRTGETSMVCCITSRKMSFFFFFLSFISIVSSV